MALCRYYRETGNVETAVRTAEWGAFWLGSKEVLMTKISVSPETVTAHRSGYAYAFRSLRGVSKNSNLTAQKIGPMP